MALARTLILKPAILILDEVTSSVDEHTRNQMMTLLTDLQKQYGLAYLFISHDMRAVRRMADTVLVMKAGTVVEQGPARQIFEAPKNAYTRQLLQDSFLLPDPTRNAH